MNADEHNKDEDEDSDDEPIVVRGFGAQVITLGRRHGPLAALVTIMLTGVGTAIYQGTSKCATWIGVNVVTPVVQQHLETMKALQKSSAEQSDSMRSQSESVKAINQAVTKMSDAIADNNHKLDQLISSEALRGKHAATRDNPMGP